MMRALLTGAWLTAERIRIYSWMMVAFGCVAIGGLLMTGDGLVDAWGRPLGTDFANVWSAGRMVWDGAALHVYEPVEHHRVQQSLFGAGTPFYGWHYPPAFLMIAALLAVLPYGAALTVWMFISFPLYLKTVHVIMPERLAVLAGAGFPAVMVNLLHGQNGFFTTGLLGLGLWQLDRRPVLAGVMFGLLSYKPQFGLLIPVVLLVTRRWTTFISASLSVLALAAISTWVFGVDVWGAFVSSTHFTRTEVLEQGGVAWATLQSVFAAVRSWGGGVEVAYTVHFLFALSIAAGVLWLWRSHAHQDVKAAGLALGTVMVTPYVMDYDLVVLALPIAWMVKRGLQTGFANGEKSILALVWFMPLFSRVTAHASLIPIGFIVMGVFFVLILNRARTENRARAVTCS